MISKKYNCIFVHIPKNGGSSIEDMIWPPTHKRTEQDLWMGFVKPFYNKYQTGGLQHLFASQIKQEVGDTFFDQAFIFTMVRNPWDKAVSQFTYMQKREDLRKFLGMPEHCEFAQYLELITHKAHVQWEPQYKFFLDDHGESLVSEVFRFENFETDVARIMDRLGVKFTNILHAKKSSRVHYSQYYNEESKEMVADIYAKDISLLNYAFDG